MLLGGLTTERRRPRPFIRLHRTRVASNEPKYVSDIQP